MKAIPHLALALVLTLWTAPFMPVHHGRFGVAEMISGTAERPFIYRALAPAAVGLVRIVLPIELSIAVVTLAAYTALSVLLRLLARELGLPGYSWPLAMLLYMAIATRIAHVYDPLNWALWAAALLALARRQWRALIVVFAYATVCKETALLLLPIVAAVARQMPVRKWIWLCSSLAIIYAALRGALLWTFSASPGTVMELHLPQHLYSLPWFMAWLMALSTPLAITWRQQPPLIRVTLAMLPIWAALYLIGGVPGELRVYGEVWGVVGLMLAQALHVTLEDRYGTRATNRIRQLAGQAVHVDRRQGLVYPHDRHDPASGQPADL